MPCEFYKRKYKDIWSKIINLSGNYPNNNRTLIYSLGISASQAFGSYGNNGWLHWSREEQWAVLYAQNFMLISFVWCLAFMSPSFLHRTFSLYHSIPFKNKVWVGSFFIVIAIQFVFCAVSLVNGPFHLSKIPWYVYFLGFIWPVIALPVQELVKMHDDKEFTRFQKRSKLEFSTKVRKKKKKLKSHEGKKRNWLFFKRFLLAWYAFASLKATFSLITFDYLLFPYYYYVFNFNTSLGERERSSHTDNNNWKKKLRVGCFIFCWEH